MKEFCTDIFLNSCNKTIIIFDRNISLSQHLYSWTVFNIPYCPFMYRFMFHEPNICGNQIWTNYISALNLNASSA